MSRKAIRIILITVLLIAALLYGLNAWWLQKYGSSPQPVPSAILDVDKNFDFPPGFPPDPGEAGKRTIPGIDSDHDGVRDDVQRWIYAFAPKEPQKQMALRQMARFFLDYALDEEYGPDVRTRSNEPLDRAVQCLYKTFNDDMHGYAEDMYLKAKILNTYGRVKRYWNNDHKVTTKEMAREFPRYESPCDGR